MTLSAAPRTLMAAMSLSLLTACTSSVGADPATERPTSEEATQTSRPASRTWTAELGDFPEFPQGRLPETLAASFQELLDEAVAEGTLRGVAAAVIVVGSGSWSGAAGVDRQGNSLMPDSPLLTASVGKTMTAAQVLRLVEDGTVPLDVPAAGYFPRELSSFDANDASIRDLLGMRSGLVDPDGYVELVDQGYTTADLVELIPSPISPAGSTTQYANINYLLLGEIIEQVTGRPLAKVVRAGVLSHPGLGGIVYRVKDAMAADGWNIETDAATLARWGYDLYGGFVVADASLREMTDFRGESYGLGTLDFSPWDEYDTPGAVGHGGMETSHVVRLVAFPDAGVVVAVQANADSFESIHDLVRGFKDAAGGQTAR